MKHLKKFESSLKLEGLFNKGKSKSPVSKSFSNSVKIAHKENIRNIIDENSSLHRKTVNGIIALVKTGGSSIELHYQIPHKDSQITSVNDHGFAYTKDGKYLDLMGISILKLIEIYESILAKITYQNK